MSKNCIAEKFGNCEGAISGEHYVSRGILELFTENGTATISGLPWIEQERFKTVGINALTANILCEKHNRDLSALDSEMKNLFVSLDAIDKYFTNPENSVENEINLSGDNIEKWLLKNCVGFIASDQIASGAQRQSITMKDEYLEILFNNGTFPEHWGLYLHLPADGIVHKFNGFSFLPKTHQNELKAAEYWINNFILNFLLGKPGQPSTWGLYRPAGIRFRQGAITKSINFRWQSGPKQPHIELTRFATSSEVPENWKKYFT